MGIKEKEPRLSPRSEAGLKKILAVKYHLNKGFNSWTDDLKNVFSNDEPIARPEYKFSGIPDPYWITGFVSGDSTYPHGGECFNWKY